MKRSLINRLLLWAALLALFVFPARAAFYGPYTLVAPIAIDGDTLRADVAIWPDTIVDVAIRVIGVDTPELRTSSACERELAQKAKAFADAWIQAHGPLTIDAVKPDKYAGRIDAVVTGRDGSTLAAALIATGHGRAYNGGAREGWCP